MSGEASFLIKTEDTSFVRDTSTGALLNTDMDALAMFRAKRAAAQKTQTVWERVEGLEDAVDGLSAKMDRILGLLEEKLK